MLVYNLTDTPLHYRKRVLLPNGGFHNFPELDSFIPDRDKALADKKIIGIGSIPSWWVRKKKMKEEERRAAAAKAETSKGTEKAEPAIVEGKPVVEDPVFNSSKNNEHRSERSGFRDNKRR